MSGFIPPLPLGRGGLRAALRLPSGVEEEVMLETEGAGVAAAEGISVTECDGEGLCSTSGLPRGEVESVRESGEPSGLPRSESSAMAG